MKGRATFGDFIQAARRHLGEGAMPSGDGGFGGNVEEVSRSLLREIIVLSRYLSDITAPFHGLPAHGRPVPAPWVLASVQAREALANAAGFLARPRARHKPAVPAASPLARRVDGATMSLMAGRDLLHTHFSGRSHGGPQHRSEWGPVITSAPVTRALLEEIGWLARHSAQYAANVAVSPSPGSSGLVDERRRLSAACQWLWVLDARVRAAHQREPVAGTDQELLRAIPVNTMPGRLALTGSEPVSMLCEAVASIAERARWLAWASVHEVSRVPEVTATSLRQVAEASTLTSHHCHLLLTILAARSAQAGLIQVSEQLSEAAGAAVHAREAWLRAAQAVRQVTTSPPGGRSALASEAWELALSTGRLAYEDPGWTPGSGPFFAVRPPEGLVPEVGGLPVAVAAVHQACSTLSLLGRTEQERIRVAGRAGCILVPTQSLPYTYRVPQPFARAPTERAHLLVSRYADGGRASRQTTAGIEKAAEAVRAPSRILTAARRATSDNRCAGPVADRSTEGGTRAGLATGKPDTSGPAESNSRPGPVEHALHRLGVTQPELLTRAADIDRAGEQLIIDAATRPGSSRCPSAGELNRPARATMLINDAVPPADPRAAALPRRPEQPAREPPEREPEP